MHHRRTHTRQIAAARASIGATTDARLDSDPRLPSQRHAALLLCNQLRVERALVIARDVEGEPAALDQHRLLAVAVAAVGPSVGGSPPKCWSISAFSIRSASAFFNVFSMPFGSKASWRRPSRSWSSKPSEIAGCLRQADRNPFHPSWPTHTELLTVPHPQTEYPELSRRSIIFKLTCPPPKFIGPVLRAALLLP